MAHFLRNRLALLALMFFAGITSAQAEIACPDCDITVTPLQPPDPSLTCADEPTFFEFEVRNNTPVTQAFDYTLEDLDPAHADLADVFISDSTCGSFTDDAGVGSLTAGKTCVITIEVLPTADRHCEQGCIDWQLIVTPDNSNIIPIENSITPCFSQAGPITVTAPSVPGTLFCGDPAVELPFIITNHNQNTQDFTYAISEISDPGNLMTIAITDSDCGSFAPLSGVGELLSEESCTVEVTETPTASCQEEGCATWQFVMTPDDPTIDPVTYTFQTCFQPQPPGPPDCVTDPDSPDCPQPLNAECASASQSNILGDAANYAVLSANDITNNDHPVVTKFCNGKAGAVGSNDLSPSNTGGYYTGVTPNLLCTSGSIDNVNASDGADCVCAAQQSFKTAKDNAGCTTLTGDFGSDIQSLPTGGYYCLSGNTFLNGTLTLNAPGPYYFFITGDFHVQVPSQVLLGPGLNDDQIYWIVQGHHFIENPNPNDELIFLGNVITVNGDIHVDHSSGVDTGRYLTCNGDIDLHAAFAIKP